MLQFQNRYLRIKKNLTAFQISRSVIDVVSILHDKLLKDIIQRYFPVISSRFVGSERAGQVTLLIYKVSWQTLPLNFRAIFEASRLILITPLHIFFLILIGLRILKWCEPSLKVNFGLIYWCFQGTGGISMWLSPSLNLYV